MSEQKKAWWFAKNKKQAKKEQTPKDQTKNNQENEANILVTQIERTNLMTEFEQKMYEVLCRALPKSQIFVQVSFNSLIKENEQIKAWQDAWQLKQGIRNKFNRKVVDFVIYDVENHQVLAIVELDDPSHLNPKQIAQDEQRDLMLKQAGYFVLRFTQIPTFTEIIEKMRAIRTLSN